MLRGVDRGGTSQRRRSARAPRWRNGLAAAHLRVEHPAPALDPRQLVSDLAVPSSMSPLARYSIVCSLAACGSSSWDLGASLVPKDLPRLPPPGDLDYQPSPAMAHAALPRFDAAQQRFVGSGRVWLKGSATCRGASVAGRDIILEPPYFTAVLEAPAGANEVRFKSDGGAAHEVRVVVPDAAALNTPDTPFSALFFGDFQPFVIRDDVVRVNPGDRIDRDDDEVGSGLPDRTLLAMRAMFERAATGRLGTFPRPAFACGVGDQVYVEGDYHSWDEHGQRHPMSAWTVDAQPRPRVALSDLPRFLDVCYRGNWSFPVFGSALQACPTVMVWDDHDIRDGWGSQGDEHVYRDTWFRGFRDAFVAHQFARGPRAVDESVTPVDAPLWQSFVMHGVPVFVLDLRTCRDIAVPQVLGDRQWQALRSWFASLDAQRQRHYVLVSSVPLFYRVAERAKIAELFTSEARDDLLDTWNSGPNEPEWRRVVDEVANAGARGLRGLIVSGDYHVNSLCRVTAAGAGGSRETIAYELIASGLAADSYGDWKQRMAREGWFAETPIAVSGGNLHTEFRFAKACPSFGGLSFDGDVTAFVFQVDEDGCFEQRVTLQWGAPSEPLGDAMARGTTRLDTAKRK
jgi:hypothetical protein